MQREQLEYFAKLIERELGIVYSEFNYFQLQNRLEEIVRVLSLQSVDELYSRVRMEFSGYIKQLMLDTATNNETSFFRDPKIFEAVKAIFVPKAIEKIQAGKKVRIWSAACSFGQEPYSLGILAQENLQKISLRDQVEILATDISSKALDRAKSGRYTQFEVQRGLSAALMVKYFTKDDENYWNVAPKVKDMVKFDRQNLLDSFDSRGKFDLIFCRNVLIYQNVENKKKIIRKLGQSLESDGYLVMGAGESLIGLSEDFEIVRSNESSFYQIKRVGAGRAA